MPLRMVTHFSFSSRASYQEYPGTCQQCESSSPSLTQVRSLHFYGQNTAMGVLRIFRVILTDTDDRELQN